MRNTYVPIKFCGHNMTEGVVTTPMAQSDVAFAQEVSRTRFRAGLPSARFDIAFDSDHDPHMAIAWDKRRFTLRRDPVFLKFHGSGTGDPKIPDNIPTPRRGILLVDLLDHHSGQKIDTWVTWLLNSWDPIKGDQFTATRKRIVQDLELPIVRQALADSRKAGNLSIGEADWNSIKAPLKFPGYKTTPKHGLDRFVISDSEDWKFGRVHEGPKTGVGNDMQHNSVLIEGQIRQA